MKWIMYWVGVILLFASCSAADKLNREYVRMNREVFRKAKADTAFLKLEGNFYDKPWLLYANIEVYMRALHRFDSRLRVVNNRFMWDRSAEEMRMSEDIYNYFANIFNDYNERLAKGYEEIYLHKKGRFALRWKEGMSPAERMGEKNAESCVKNFFMPL